MKVFISPLAEKKIKILLVYLEQEWSVKSKEKFLAVLYRRINLISRNPKSCQSSTEFPNLYKCLVNKHSSFYYRIKEKEIEIITLIDNRQNPDKIAEEITKFFG